MPGYKRKFDGPVAQDFTIIEIGDNDNKKIVGLLRVKPSSVLWKPSGQGKFYNVSLDKFTTWITDLKTKAARTVS